MIRLKVAICCLLILIVLTGGTCFGSSYINITIDEVPVTFNDSLGFPFVDDMNRTQVPFKATMEAFGCSVSWDNANQQAVAEFMGTVVKVPIGTSYIFRNGERIDIDTTAKTIKGRTYLPIAAVLKAFGADVSWNKYTSTVEVDRPEMKQAKVSTLDMDTLTSQASDMRKQAIDASGMPSVEKYREDFSSTVNYFNDEEVKALLAVKSKVGSLTKEAALEDVETLFKYLKASYGAYSYFGGDERFEIAKHEIEIALSDQTTVTYVQFKSIILKAFHFIRDEHFSVDRQTPGSFSATNYKYYNANIHVFDKDSIGYYKVYNGEKWYYVESNNPYVSIKPTMMRSGEIVYSPVYWGPIGEVNATKTFTLKNAQKTLTEIFDWKTTYPMGSDPVTVKSEKIEWMQGIAYTPFRRPHFDMSTIDAYKRAGALLKQEKTIILDARGNNGGGDPNQYGWMNSFASNVNDYEYKSIYSYKTSKLSLEAFKSFSNGRAKDYSSLGSWRIYEKTGRWIENDTRVVVLMDDKIGSSGENLIYMLRGMDNVIFVGSNTIGCSICGMIYDVYLPNSGMSIRSGMMLASVESGENIDGVGLAPDIWCDPSISLEAVLNYMK